MYSGDCAEAYDDVTRLDRSEINAIVEVLQDFGTNAVVIDAACGSGRLTVPLLERTVARVLALDNSQRSLELLRSRIANPSQSERLEIIDMDITALDIVQPAQAYVLGTSTISHFSPAARAQVLKEAHRVLSVGGLVLVTYAPRLVLEETAEVVGASGERYRFSSLRGEGGTVQSLLERSDGSLRCTSEVYMHSMDEVREQLESAGFDIASESTASEVSGHVLFVGVKS